MLTTMSKYKRKAKIQANYKVRKNAGGRSRTDMDYKARRILNPVRLPVSPLRHIILDKSILFYHIYNLIARKNRTYSSIKYSFACWSIYTFLSEASS